MNTLKTYLAGKKLTESAFAHATGLKQPTIWRIANGKSQPSIKLALLIEKATNGAIKALDLRPDLKQLFKEKEQ